MEGIEKEKDFPMVVVICNEIWKRKQYPRLSNKAWLLAFFIWKQENSDKTCQIFNTLFEKTFHQETHTPFNLCGF
jgi:hypothetical protein